MGDVSHYRTECAGVELHEQASQRYCVCVWVTFLITGLNVLVWTGGHYVALPAHPDCLEMLWNVIAIWQH